MYDISRLRVNTVRHYVATFVISCDIFRTSAVKKENQSPLLLCSLRDNCRVVERRDQ